MNKLLRALVVSISFLGLMAIPSKAGEVGFAIGAYGNISEFTTEGTETEGNAKNAQPATELHRTTVTKDHEFGSIFAEVAYKSTRAGLTVGLEYIPIEALLGEGTRTDTTADAGETNQDDSTYTAKAEISDHISLYVEPTIYATDGVGFYVKGGVSRVTVNSLENITSGTDSSAYGNEDVFGAMYGFGIRAKHSSGFLVKAEWAETKYETVELESSTGNQNKIKAKPESEAVRIAIGFQF